MLVLNKETTGTIFITSLVWRGPWLGIEPGTSRTRSQHSSTRLSRRRYYKIKLFFRVNNSVCQKPVMHCFVCVSSHRLPDNFGHINNINETDLGKYVISGVVILDLNSLTVTHTIYLELSTVCIIVKYATTNAIWFLGQAGNQRRLTNCYECNRKYTEKSKLRLGIRVVLP